MFISDADLRTILSDSTLAQIISIDKYNRNRAEAFAIEEAKAYLNFLYDTDAIFGVEAFDYSQAMAYAVDQVILSSEGIPYTCIATAPVGASLNNAQYFKQQDQRSALVVMIVVDLLIYHLYSKSPSNRIPEHTKERYESALKKLKEIRTQKMNPGLPLASQDNSATGEERTDTIEIISRPKRNNYY